MNIIFCAFGFLKKLNIIRYGGGRKVPWFVLEMCNTLVEEPNAFICPMIAIYHAFLIGNG